MKILSENYYLRLLQVIHLHIKLLSYNKKWLWRKCCTFNDFFVPSVTDKFWSSSDHLGKTGFSLPVNFLIFFFSHFIKIYIFFIFLWAIFFFSFFKESSAPSELSSAWGASLIGRCWWPYFNGSWWVISSIRDVGPSEFHQIKEIFLWIKYF